jgi:ATP-dependent DNA helicase Q1
MRLPETVDQRDVTVEAWQILKIATAVQRQGGRLTLNGLGDLARGAGSGAFDGGNGKGKTKGKTTLDLDDTAGGKIGLPKDVSDSRPSIVFIPNLITLYLRIVKPGYRNAIGGVTPFSLSGRVLFRKLLRRQCLRRPRAAGHTTHSNLS